jgi:hypothetical protein
MMDHEKAQAVYPQVFEFTPGHEIVINEQFVQHQAVTPDIEVSSTLVGDGGDQRTELPPPGDESLW